MAVHLGVRHLWALTVGVAAVVACVQTILPLGPTPGTANEVIGPAGGTLSTSEGTTLVVPPDALDENENITIALNPSAPPLTQATPLTAAHVFGPEGLTFATPVCMTLAYEPQLLPDGATGQSVFLYSAPYDSSVYEPMPTMPVDPTHVMGMTTHFSNVVAGYGGGGVELAADAGCVTGEAGEAGEAVDTSTAGEGGA